MGVPVLSLGCNRLSDSPYKVQAQARHAAAHEACAQVTEAEHVLNVAGAYVPARKNTCSCRDPSEMQFAYMYTGQQCQISHAAAEVSNMRNMSLHTKSSES